MRQSKNIIYVNYTPYENSGKILDFLLENFEQVFLFSLGFYNLENKKKYNMLLIFRQGRLEEEHFLFSFNIPTSSKITYLLIPIRSSINLFQIIWYCVWLKRRFGTIDRYFTVNAFPAWIGNILKKFGIVKKTVFWVWDYYPPIHENKIVMLMRYIYWQFDKISSHSDRVAFVNQKLIDLRKDLGVLPKDAQFPIIPIGTEQFNVKLQAKKNVIFCFIGVLKRSHGLDVIFDNANIIMKNFPTAHLEIIGSGPDELYFRERAKTSSIPNKFYGYLEDKAINDVLKKCSIGIATYTPDKSNVSHYSDPGKIKQYISLGIPVIITNIVYFSHEIDHAKAGVIIAYNNSEDLISGVKKIMSDYEYYQKNALALSKKYYYKNIYKQMFRL